MNRYPCQVCGHYHDSTACPQVVVDYEIPQPKQGMTINGLTMGEQQIIERLDRLIELLSVEDSES